ncbi:MAG: hypothetical protein ABJA78_11430 [Ferruginibacter sp.]
MTKILPGKRPLTKCMEQLLMDSHERQLQHQKPYSIYYSRSAKGLLERGLFYTTQYQSDTGTYQAFFITQLGVEYLNSIK